MRAEKSAGGVVFYNGRVLLLRKRGGFWVLPKGRIEEEEGRMEAAVREVFEESGINAEILEYIDSIQYTYRNQWTHYEWVSKKVYWYAMKAITHQCKPQIEEGFSFAQFVEGKDAVKMLRYDDERCILQKALDRMNRHESKMATNCR